MIKWFSPFIFFFLYFVGPVHFLFRLKCSIKCINLYLLFLYLFIHCIDLFDNVIHIIFNKKIFCFFIPQYFSATLPSATLHLPHSLSRASSAPLFHSFPREPRGPLFIFLRTSHLNKHYSLKTIVPLLMVSKRVGRKMYVLNMFFVRNESIVSIYEFVVDLADIFDPLYVWITIFIFQDIHSYLYQVITLWRLLRRYVLLERYNQICLNSRS